MVEAAANALARNIGVQGDRDLVEAFIKAFGPEDPASTAAARSLDADGTVIETLQLDDAAKVLEHLEGADAQAVLTAIEAAKAPASVRPREEPTAGPSQADGAVITMQGFIVAQTGAGNAIATFEQHARTAGVDIAKMDATIVLHPAGRPDVPRAIRAMLGATEAQGARPA